LRRLTSSFRAAAARLPPREAAVTAEQLIDEIGKASAPDKVEALVGVVAVLVGRLERAGAARVAEKLWGRMNVLNESRTFASFAEAFAALADKLDPEWCGGVALRLLDRLSDARDVDVPREVARLLGALAANLPCGELANLLKHPACLGPARQAVLRLTEPRSGRRLESVWDFVDWAREQEPGIDLASPYRPAR
jgi:hypothetical protein